MALAASADGLAAPPAPSNVSGPAETPGAEGWRTLPDSLPASFTSGIQLEVIVALLIAPLILKLAAWIPHGKGKDPEQPAAGEPRPSPGEASSCAAAAWELQRSALWSAGARHAMSVLRLSDHEINSARRAGTVSSVSGGHIVKSFLVQVRS